MALNDEDPQVRELAIQVVGRLGGLNPAVVMPALRRHLMQLLADLEHSPDSRQREGAWIPPVLPDFPNVILCMHGLKTHSCCEDSLGRDPRESRAASG